MASESSVGHYFWFFNLPSSCVEHISVSAQYCAGQIEDKRQGAANTFPCPLCWPVLLALGFVLHLQARCSRGGKNLQIFLIAQQQEKH